MKRWITIAVITILVGGLIFGGLRITDIQAQLNRLQSDYVSLQSQYGELSSNYKSLESNYESLESDFKSLRSDYDILQGRMAALQSSYNRLEAENRDLQRLLEQYEKVPHAYYSTGAFPYHANTYEELEWFLIFEFESPRGYELNVFDCSESAAYLEWALETAGFDAQIAVGRAPFNPNIGHAWVIAYPKGYRVAIEATALTGEYNLLYLFIGRVRGIVYRDDLLIPGWKDYYEGYDHLFENIYYAIRNYGTLEEWNWWEGYFGFR